MNERHPCEAQKTAAFPPAGYPGPQRTIISFYLLSLSHFLGHCQVPRSLGSHTGIRQAAASELTDLLRWGLEPPRPRDKGCFVLLGWGGWGTGEGSPGQVLPATGAGPGVSRARKQVSRCHTEGNTQAKAGTCPISWPG